MTADTKPVVLVVEDEEAFVDALVVGLTREGFTVEVARDGEQALTQFDAVKPDVVLLDLMLPRISGIDVCRAIRQKSSTPIIMVTARSEEIDTVVGLEVGADDYVSKPYSFRELLARTRAVLRRVPAAVNPTETRALTIGGISLDSERHEVTVLGESVAMALKEFELLEHLMNSAGRVVHREHLIDSVWGADYVGDTKTLDVHIKRLRAKVEPEAAKPIYIKTVRGVGYKFEKAPEPSKAD